MIRWQPIPSAGHHPAAAPARKPTASFMSSIRADAEATNGNASRGSAHTAGHDAPSAFPSSDGREPSSGGVGAHPSAPSTLVRLGEVELTPPDRAAVAPGVDTSSALTALPAAATACDAAAASMPAADASGRWAVMPAIGVRVMAAGALVETIEVPWGLIASGHLSHANRLEARDLPGAAHVVDASPLPPSAVPADGSRRISSPAELASVGARSDSSGMPATCFRETVSDAAMATERAVPARAASTRDWALQLVRCVERHGGVTVYVRDFRLNDAQVEQLSESLYRACTGNGAAAPRIVVNGRATRGNDAGDNHAS